MSERSSSSSSSRRRRRRRSSSSSSSSRSSSSSSRGGCCCCCWCCCCCCCCCCRNNWTTNLAPIPSFHCFTLSILTSLMDHQVLSSSRSTCHVLLSRPKSKRSCTPKHCTVSIAVSRVKPMVKSAEAIENWRVASFRPVLLYVFHCFPLNAVFMSRKHLQTLSILSFITPCSMGGGVK